MRLADALAGTQPRRSTRQWDPQGTIEHSARDRAIVAKQRDNQFETTIRYAITTPQSRKLSRGRTHAIAAAFAGFAHHNFYRRRRLAHAHAALARRWMRSGDLLSVPELAALAHIPYDPATPGLHRASAKVVTPSPRLATSGPTIKPIGISDASQPRPVGLHVADGRHHVHIMGATGSGKSELMARMILSDAENDRGVVVVDPKGDLIDDVLARLPERFADRVTLLDSDSAAQQPVLNPLDGPDTDSTVDNLVSIFSRVYSANWGPRTDDLLRAGLLTLRAIPEPPTLMNLPKLLTNATFRQRAQKTVHDEILAGFWSWYDELSDASRAQIAAPLMNKLRGLLLRPFVRSTLTAGPSTVDMTDVLNGGICLVRLAKGTLSTDTVRLIGSLVVARTWHAATLRSQLPKAERRDCALYLDEFQNFLNLAYPPEEMLPEARAYGLSLVLAHHNYRQLSRDLQEAMSVNARNKIFFNASPEDARRLAHHTSPHLTEHDLTNLGRFQVALRLVAHSQDMPACTARTEQLPPHIPGRADHIRQLAQSAYQPPADAPEPKYVRDPRRTA
nr:similar to Type IV secretory pathway VirD4 components [Kibdelosporangium sp. MJ126-NF4]CTQ99254.1 similar to Type IV secretory pathway VirD4 components [Kibdelosporangium sp. MJ126-NF4]